MARSYTSEEAAELEKVHRKLLTQVDDALKSSPNYKQEITSELRALLESGELANEIGKDLSSGKPVDAVRPHNLPLVVAIAKQNASSLPISQLREIQSRGKTSVLPAIESMNAVPDSAFKRLITSKKIKDAGDEAYTRLLTMLSNNYREKIQEATELLRAIQQTEPADALIALSKNRDSFIEILRKRTSRLHVDTPVRIEKTVKKHEDIQKVVSAIPKMINEAKSEIRQSVDAYINSVVMRTLANIPIEDIGRGGHNIKVKTLRSAGYKTVADLCNPFGKDIASCKGIGASATRAIKAMVCELEAQTKDSVRIRLNADNRDSESTRLVMAISAYRELLAINKECGAVFEQNSKELRSDVRMLRTFTKWTLWPILEANEKAEITSTYQRLAALLNGNFGKSAKQLLARHKSLTRMKPNDAWEDFSHNSIAFINTLEEIVPGATAGSDKYYGLPEDLAVEIQGECFFPEGLLCTLRRYQEWGVKYILHQERVLLGDEMGLGKTIQAIATMVSLRNTGATHFMVVCPASVVANWCREIGKHSRLRAIRVHGQSRDDAVAIWEETGGVAVTTYETLSLIGLSDTCPLDFLAVDEAHYVKNCEAARTKNVAKLCKRTQRVLFMTGTALENKVEEMIDLIGMLKPGMTEELRRVSFMASAPAFRLKVAPVYYRRRRADVLAELPELIENEEWCQMDTKETTVYEQAVLARKYALARRVSWSVGDPKFSSKAQRLKEIVAEAAEDGRKVIVFSFFLDTLEMVRRTLGPACMETITGSVSPQRRQEIIDEFDEAQAGTVLALQIQAGGTGLNIQSASVVVICEPQLKPSIENQAISRAYRMGQARNVLVHRLLCPDSIDERMMDLLEKKQREFDAFADKSVAAEKSAELDETTLGDLIEEEIERIQKKHAESTEATRG